MRSCEEYLQNLSALVDGELHGSELTETIRHLTVCEPCMVQFEAFQKLQTELELNAGVTKVPERIWDKIYQETSVKPKTQFIKFNSKLNRAISIAAILIISFILGYQSREKVVPMMTANDPIVLASNRGNMNENQFLSLTRDLLSADPAYHKKMYMILHTLVAENLEGNMEPLENVDYGENSNDEMLQNADFEQNKETFRFKDTGT